MLSKLLRLKTVFTFRKSVPLDKAQSSSVTQSVKDAEALTNAEIRVCVYNQAIPKKVERYFEKPQTDEFKARWAAEQEFKNLGIEDTQDRHGVLIFVAVKEKRVEIIADTSVEEALGSEKLEEICRFAGQEIANGFRDGFKATAIGNAVETLGKELALHFPKTDTDKNELPDKVIQG